ncbi:MAG: YihY/virulence factor BrkB family protein [Gammaproteobacteria bacterium]|nr:YihY/virulence factor BrkB family protein [Gammaproteobacteria bacterium]NNF66600.1 YihY/virulence factor BrkB family protein [Gammaproteobacteria bacterium]
MWDIVRQRIEEILWSPQANSSNILVRTALRWARFPYALIRDAMRGELTLRAMSLVYTTLLAIVPLIAFSFSVLKAFGIHKQVQPLLYSFLQPLGDEGIKLTDQIISFVDNTRGVALGSVGLALLIYTVISMVQKIEEAFNFVWQVQRTRSLARRFSEYLSVIIIAPVLMATALGLKGTVENTVFAKWLLNLPAINETVIVLGFFMPYLLVILTFSFIYGLIPNTTVSFRAAILGGLVGGATWSMVGAVFASFVGASTRYEAIYSSFAIPLFALIWLYISWLVVLLGARVSYYYQYPEYLRRGRKHIELTNRLRERLALALMYLVGEEFRHERPHWTTNSLAKHLGMPALDLSKVIEPLKKNNLLVATDEGVLMPGRDTESIQLAEILNAVRHDPSEAGVFKSASIQRVDDIIADVESAAGDHLAQRTLSSLIDSPETTEQAQLPG